MNKVTLLQGDVLEKLKELPEESVHCVVTSPPYWGLRDYGIEGQLGLEPTIEEYVTKMVEVFREVRRVLRKDGVCFLNISDSYSSGNRKTYDTDAKLPNRQHASRPGTSSIQHEPFYGMNGKVPGDCPLRDSIWNHPCDACQAASILRTFGNIHGGASSFPNQGNKESQNDHFPTSDSLNQTQIHQSCAATQGRMPSLPPAVGLLPSSQESICPSSFSECRQNVSNLNHEASCPSSSGSPYPSIPESEHKMVSPSLHRKGAGATKGRHHDISGNGAIVDASAHRIKDKVFGSCAYLNYSIPSRHVKPKDMCLIPQRLALSLQIDGWFVRSDIIWAKPNPMPESCKDRPTRSHENIFLLTKSAKYFWDAEAVREEQAQGTFDRYKPNEPIPSYKKSGGSSRKKKSFTDIANIAILPNGRNIRSVWNIATAPFPEAHFATFPPALVEKCIAAGTSEKGMCPKCGKPWVKLVEKGALKGRTAKDGDGYILPKALSAVGTNIKGRSEGWKPNHKHEYQVLDWQPSCKCGLDPIPTTVLDPFSGSGTTCLVAAKMGRNSIGIELKPEYMAMARKRIKSEMGFLVEFGGGDNFS